MTCKGGRYAEGENLLRIMSKKVVQEQVSSSAENIFAFETSRAYLVGPGSMRFSPLGVIAWQLSRNGCNGGNTREFQKIAANL